MHMIYRYNIAALIALILLSTSHISCKKFLDVKPLSEIPESEMWKNQREVRAGVNEIYNSFRSAMRGNIFAWGEMRSDNFVVATDATSVNQRLISNQLTNDLAVTSWTALYKTINNANYAIKYIPGSEIPNDAEKNDYLAQAYAMRALTYFYALRVWGDVPVYLEPVQELDGGTFKDRTPMADVLKNVVYADLKLAEQLIDPTNLERKRISRAGILAIQADVLMWMKDYATAEQVIGRLKTLSTRWAFQPSMEKMKFTFTTDLNRKMGDDRPNADEYGPGANELIFLVHFDLEEDVVSEIYSLFSGAVLLSPKLRDIFVNASNTTPRDTRFDNYLRPAGLVPGEFRMHKYALNGADVSNTTFGSCEIAYPIYRFTEILLMEAECKARLDKFQDALNILSSTVRTRAGVASSTRTANTFASREALVDYILLEKQIEMVGEGKRWFDLVRTGTAVKVMKPINGMSNDHQMLFPLNFNILLRNSNIKQNPGYN